MIDSRRRHRHAPLAAVVCLLLFGARSAHAEPFGWPQPGGAGTSVVLSYSFMASFLQNFQGIPELQLRAATTEAFATWSQYAPLHFVERPDSGPPPADADYIPQGLPEIRIGAHDLGDALVLAHAFFPIATAMSGLAGDIHLNTDTGDLWGLGDGFPTIDFREVMLHEIGHALGLRHLEDANSIMNPAHGFFFSGAAQAFLMPADIAALQAIYGAGVGSVSPVPEPSTLVLVTAGLVASFVRRARRRVTRP